MADRYAVVWTRTAAGPVKMGNLVATGTECRFSYTDDFLHRRPAPGFSLLSSAELYASNPIVYRTSERMRLHPRLMALIPGESPGNLQRRLYTELLAKRDPAPAPGFETDWEILLMSGHGGIGHIDVFYDDREAEHWYGHVRARTVTVGKRSAVWQFVREEVQQSEHEISADTVAELLGPTPSVGGMIPKLLVSIPDAATWDGRFAPPDTPTLDGQSYVDVILKIEPAIYAGVADLEALCLQVHRELGFEVPRSWRAEVDGMQLLAIERFDQNASGLPIPMESFLCVMATGSREVFGSGDTDLAAVGAMLEKLATVVNLNPKYAQREFYRRFVAAFLTGNGDMHLENLAFLGGPESVRVAPVYDPAPMRAWPRHNLRSAIPIELDTKLSFAANIISIGSAFGLKRREAADIWQEFLENTASYPERILALQEVPVERRQALVDIIQRERKAIATELTM